ncbi:MAG: hypothetical protein HRU09_09915 [Oligoflexales bacterium]|nr:hypothetical protein [Oligoflexales bacterium]
MKILGIFLVFGIVACGETMSNGKSDESNKLLTSNESSAQTENYSSVEAVPSTKPQSEDTQRAALTERIKVFVDCNFTDDEAALVCEGQEEEASNVKYKFDFKVFDFDGNELDSQVSFEGGFSHIISDFSEMSYMEVSTKNPYVDIENPSIDF